MGKQRTANKIFFYNFQTAWTLIKFSGYLAFRISTYQKIVWTLTIIRVTISKPWLHYFHCYSVHSNWTWTIWKRTR